jgi:hypothetical protein
VRAAIRSTQIDDRRDQAEDGTALEPDQAESTKIRSVASHHRIVMGNDKPIPAIPFTSQDWKFS